MKRKEEIKGGVNEEERGVNEEGGVRKRSE